MNPSSGCTSLTNQEFSAVCAAHPKQNIWMRYLRTAVPTALCFTHSPIPLAQNVPEEPRNYFLALLTANWHVLLVYSCVHSSRLSLLVQVICLQHPPQTTLRLMQTTRLRWIKHPHQKAKLRESYLWIRAIHLLKVDRQVPPRISG
jgi:hypothetical protein